MCTSCWRSRFLSLIMLMLLFVVPKDIETEASVYIFDQTSVLENVVKAGEEKSKKKTGQFFVDSRDEVVDGMTKNKAAAGLIITGDPVTEYQIELLTQPYTTEAMVKFFKIQMEDMLSLLSPRGGLYPPEVYQTVKVSSLEEGLRDELPFNKRMVPLILMIMVGMMGIFAMVSLIGQERSDETIRAYKVSPARLWEFILSKHLILLAIGCVTFSIVYLPIIGFDGYLSALLIMVPTIILGSAIGVMLGSVFDNPMSGISWVMLLFVIFGLPAVSLFAPVFSPDWIKVIPSYHTLFGLDAAMFPNNNSHIIWNEAGILFAIAAVLLVLSMWIFTFKLRKEV